MTFQGLGAAPGRASGPALVVRAEGPLGEVPAGAILVARVVHPYMAPLFQTIGGVVVEDGGLLQHAAILAREFGVPAVVGVTEACSHLAGAVVTVDGTSGTVSVAPVRK